MCNQLSQKIDNLNINNINKQELKRKEGKYIGQVVYGKAEGKGTWYGYNGNIYEGEWKNNKQEGKGIFYYNNGDRYEGDFRNSKFEGKGIYYYNNGDRYEGEWKNEKKKEKELFILGMVIEGWLIIIMVKKQESMLDLLKMERLKQKIINLD